MASTGSAMYSKSARYAAWSAQQGVSDGPQDRFATGAGGFRGRGGFRGGFGGGFGGRGGGGGFGFRGGFRGGFMGGGGMGMGMGGGGGMGMGMGGAGRGGRNFSNDLYADYNGPDGSAANGGMAVDGVGSGLPAEPAEPNQQIMVRNVCHESSLSFS